MIVHDDNNGAMKIAPLILKQIIMKKSFTFCFAILLVSFYNYGQSTWEYHENDSETYSRFRYSDLNWNNDIITISTRTIKQNYNEYKRKYLLRLIDPNSGSIIQEGKYNVDSLIVDLVWIYPIPENKEYIVVGGAHFQMDTVQRGYFLATRWNEDLQLLSDTLIRLEPIEKGQHLWHHNGRITENGKLLYIGVYSDYGPKGDNLIVQLSRKGKVEIFRTILHDHGLDYASTIEEKLGAINQYQTFGYRKYVLNKDLVPIDTLYNFDHFSSKSQAYIKRLNDIHYLVTNSYEGGFNPGIDMINKDINLIDSFDFAYSSEEWESTLIGKGIDWVDTSAIFVGANNVLGGRFYSLAQFDSNLNPKWIKYMGLDDGLSYTFYTLLATKDGGCVLFGLREEYTGIPVFINPKAYAIKFDADGNTVSTQEPNAQAWSATVFPNPSPGYFKLKIEGRASESTLQIVDMAGRKVAEYAKLEKGENRFDLSYLSAGIYVWQLMHRGELIGSGKWVKE